MALFLSDFRGLDLFSANYINLYTTRIAPASCPRAVVWHWQTDLGRIELAARSTTGNGDCCCSSTSRLSASWHLRRLNRWSQRKVRIWLRQACTPLWNWNPQH